MSDDVEDGRDETASRPLSTKAGRDDPRRLNEPAKRGAGFFAALVHSTTMLADRRHEVLDAFRRGGGVPYDRYDDFMELWAGLNASKFQRALLDQLPQAIPNVDDKLAAGIDVLEIGCGEGHATNVMAAAYPNSRFVGFDLRENAIAEARRNARDIGATNAEFRVCDLATLDATSAWDLITGFDVIHDQASLERF